MPPSTPIDIALLVSEDSDFIPAVEFVQEMRNKQVVHVGFGGHSNDLRAACRHRIDLGKAIRFSSLQRRKPEAQPPPPGIGLQRLRDQPARVRLATLR